MNRIRFDPVASLAAMFFGHLESAPPVLIPRSDPGTWRRRIGARKAFGPVPANGNCETQCRRMAGKTLRHRITGQVRSVALWVGGVEFAQDGPGGPRWMSRSFRSAAKWLRNAEVVA